MNAANKYLEGLFRTLSLVGNWPPNAPVRLGDVGIFEGGLLKQITSLDELKIPFRVRKGTSSSYLSATSSSGVEISGQVAGTLGGHSASAGEARLSMRFKEAGGFVFQAANCFIDEIENKEMVGRTIIAFFRTGEWQRQWQLIDCIVRAGSTTILVSQSAGAGLELTSNIPIEAANLARADAKLAVTSQRGEIIHLLAQPGLKPLFRLSRLKQSYFDRAFGGGSTITVAGESTQDASRVEEEMWESHHI